MTNPPAAYSQRILILSVQFFAVGGAITLLNVSTLLYFKIQDGKHCISHLKHTYTQSK